MECPTVTVLVPVLNGERFLREAVDSILRQTWTDFELLVVDDGSTDSTAAILDSYHDPRLQILTNNSTKGVTPSLNRGLAHARGEYVARIDADDIALPERLAKQVWFLNHHLEVALVTSATETIDADGTTISVDYSCLSPEQLYYMLMFANCIYNCSVTFRRELVLELGGYDESMKLAPDYDLWVQVSRRAKIAKLDEVLAKWRDTQTSISSRFKAEQSAYAKEIFLKHMRNLMDDSINVDETLCFHNVSFPERDFSITYHSLSLLERIHERLLSESPQGLRRAEIKKQSDYTLGRYIALMLLNAKTRDAVSALLNPRYRKSLLYFAGRKLTSDR